MQGLLKNQAYRCPSCQGPLDSQIDKTTEYLVCHCGGRFPVNERIPNFIYPPQLLSSDNEFQSKYNNTANQYNKGLEWLFNSFYENEILVRNYMIDFLTIKPGQRILEIGCGTGRDTAYIMERLQGQGELFAQDISEGMLRIAQNELSAEASDCKIEYFLSNAAYLPFEDGFFDAVYHFGGLNTFSELDKAIHEMTRVVHPGGKVVIGDEGIAPWLREDSYGKILVNANPLYQHVPPLDLLPKNAQNVSLQWLLGNAFYLIVYTVGKGLPKIDLDLPIPGERGGTLRSRYYETTNAM
jgi:ubiquinone/menaquinone biosynthesis C-methylase UbiE